MLDTGGSAKEVKKQPRAVGNLREETAARCKIMVRRQQGERT